MDSKNRLDALTGLRMVAAAMVAFVHMPFLLADDRLGPAARRMLAEGMQGLTFFFVLSGFVLAYTYHERLARPSRAGLGRYYLARVARIWPVHLLMLAVAVALPVAGAGRGAGPFIANAFLVQTWIPSLRYAASYNTPSWTLSLEAFFYLVLPLLIALAARQRVGRRRLALCALVAWLIPAGLSLALSGGGAGSVFICVFCPLVRLGEFAVGVSLGLAFVRRGETGGGSRRLWTALELFSVGLMAGLLYFCDRLPLLFRINGYYTAAAALLVFVFAHQRGVLSRAAGSRVAVYLGDISFAFYMVHGLLFYHLTRLVGLGWDPFAQAAVFVSAALVLSAAIHHAFEMPLRAAILRIGKRKPPAEPRARRRLWARLFRPAQANRGA